MSFPRYPSYKDSGVEWLGKVPAHWDVKRLGAIFRQVDEAGENHLPILCVSIHDGVSDKELGEHEMERKVTRSEDRSKYKKVEPGDLVYNMMRAWQGGFGTVEVPGMVSPAYVVARPRFPVSTEIIEHQLRTPNAVEEMRRYSQGVTDFRLRLYWEEFKCLTVAIPSPAEQSAIAAFLDQETGKIDELVAEQRRLMELLKEKRQAVISHAVARGLNPAAPLKPSGIDWLGDVPKHWDVRRVKSVSTFTTSGPRGWSERVVEEGHLFVQSGDLNDSLQVEFATTKRVQVEADAESSRTRLRDGDVVVCITGAKTGNVAVCVSVPEPAYVNQHLCLIRPSEKVQPVFLGVLLKSKIGQTYFELSQYGLKQGISLEDVREAPVLLPPLAEQAEIVSFLGAQTAKFDNLTAEAQRAIDLLQERRTALISAAVTGQIDVRRLAGKKAA